MSRDEAFKDKLAAVSIKHQKEITTLPNGERSTWQVNLNRLRFDPGLLKYVAGLLVERSGLEIDYDAVVGARHEDRRLALAMIRKRHTDIGLITADDLQALDPGDERGKHTVSAAGRRVLIVEGVTYTGEELSGVGKLVMGAGATAIAGAVTLVDRSAGAAKRVFERDFAPATYSAVYDFDEKNGLFVPVTEQPAE